MVTFWKAKLAKLPDVFIVKFIYQSLFWTTLLVEVSTDLMLFPSNRNQFGSDFVSSPNKACDLDIPINVFSNHFVL